MHTTLRRLVTIAALAGATSAHAVPIVYEGTLTPGVTVGGFIQDPALAGSPSDDFWSFSGNQGDVITLRVNRLNAALDPAITLYSGVGNDTSLLTELGGADDNLAELPGFEGPFSDPVLTFTLGGTGQYTVQVWDFASGEQIPGGFCYQITLNGAPSGPVFDCSGGGRVPVPGSLPLLGLGIAALAATGVRGLRRRAR